MAAVNDMLGSADVGRGVGDEESGQLPPGVSHDLGHDGRGCPAGGVAQPEGSRVTLSVRHAHAEAPVLVGPGDAGAAGAGGRNYSYVRASHADREQVIDVLKTAFVQGRLAKDELDLRLGRVLSSRTYADLSALTADLPVRLTKAEPPEPDRQLDTGQPGTGQPGTRAARHRAAGHRAAGHRAAGYRARPGIGREKASQGVGLRNRGAAEPGGRCGAAELRNRHRHDRGRGGPVRLRGGRAGQRADDAALMDRENAPAAGGMNPGDPGQRMMATRWQATTEPRTSAGP